MDYTAEESMEKGMGLFREHEHALAADWFKIARDVLIKHHGKLSLECVPAHYMYGLAMLYKVPIKFDEDPINLVPMEVDYLSNTATKPVVKETFYGKRIEEEDLIIDGSCDHVETAWNELCVAWTILKETGDSMEKVNILSAMGEVAYRRGQLYPEFYEEAHPENYYLKALTILENLVEPDNQRIAHLNLKISACLEDFSETEAIEYCEKAISVCRTRLKRLISETTCSSGTAPTLTAPDLNQEPPAELGEDPSLVQKKAERSALIKLTSNLLLQLDALKKSVPLNQTPTDSQLKRLIAEATSSKPTPTSSENQGSNSIEASAQMCAATHRGDTEVDSPAPPTDLKNVAGCGAEGSGAKTVTDRPGQ